MGTMKVDVYERDSALVIKPCFGRLDALAAPGFRDLAVAGIAGHTVVVVDLSDVESMDSSGLGTIVAILKRMAPGGSLRIAKPSASVRVLLDLTRLNRVLRTFDDVDTAVAA